MKRFFNAAMPVMMELLYSMCEKTGPGLRPVLNAAGVPWASPLPDHGMKLPVLVTLPTRFRMLGGGASPGSAEVVAASAAVAALASFPARLARLLGVELVRGALRVGSLAALAGDLALPAFIHGSKPTVAGTALLAIVVSI
jgi:hypothetical protein